MRPGGVKTFIVFVSRFTFLINSSFTRLNQKVGLCDWVPCLKKRYSSIMYIFSRQNEISSHSLMFSGDIDLSPRWSIGLSSGYDFKNKGVTYTQLRFERDLESWRMNFSWIPFSNRSSWNFFIGIRSGILSDIKYDKQRQRDKQL